MNVRENARNKGVNEVVEACDGELRRRPAQEWTTSQAEQHDEWAKAVSGLPLEATIRWAFTQAQLPSADEIWTIRWLADHPGCSHEELQAARGKGDISLILGHLVFERHGCFGAFLPHERDQSSVLLIKNKSPEGVRYWLKPEASTVFRELGIL
ncbi:hypothetical protein DKG74_12095 [Zavarzinia aquatilis]|uniref:Uncharacterized protein n=2 Tax=Zavarzinia aquatilis TaxID=2211142 RepID=A0A317EBR4_9PROT|nr:hypothetical protein DKG74_12095 [Zavarzinia aquatilis]